MKNYSIKNVVLTINKVKIKVRYIKYKIKNEMYYLCTSVLDNKLSVSFFKELYWKRWTVEENFKSAKYSMSLLFPKKRTHNGILSNIYLHNLVFTLNSYVINELQNFVPNGYKINNKCASYLIIKKILTILLFPKGLPIKENLKQLMKQIIKTTFKVQKDRHSERIRKSPVSSWCYFGNSFGKGAKTVKTETQEEKKKTKVCKGKQKKKSETQEEKKTVVCKDKQNKKTKMCKDKQKPEICKDKQNKKTETQKEHDVGSHIEIQIKNNNTQTINNSTQKNTNGTKIKNIPKQKKSNTKNKNSK
jgi:hypothetical protein